MFVQTPILNKKATEGWIDSRRFGEISPTLEKRRNVFKRMLEESKNVRLKNLLKECVFIVNRDIDSEREDDEERLKQR